MREPVAVRVRDCACPNTPHEEGDVVYVAPTLSLKGGLQARQDIRDALGSGQMLAELWLVTFVRFGAVAWNFLDEDGDPVPFDVEDILADMAIAEVVAEKCDELYGETVTRPLVRNIQAISQRGRTDGSTSPKSGRSKTGSSRSRTTKLTAAQPEPSSAPSTAGTR